jgi:hypothetical protein
MFFYRDRIEEDLTRIREGRSLVPSGHAKNGKKARAVADKSAGEPKKAFGIGETAAMIIAVFSLIGPYILVFIGVIGLLTLWISG